MKLPLSWLREWVDWPADWDARELARRLTMTGFEIEAISSAAPAFSGVVVAKILSAQPHPQSEKLQVCRVTTGGGELQIVCGAPNARAGLVTALATAGAVLPDDRRITVDKRRGVESAGMLCSAREIGLADTSDGIIELPDDAPLGADLRGYLDLDEAILEVNVTPNRGDAMSVLGMAREVAVLAGSTLKAPAEPMSMQPQSVTAAAPTDQITVRPQPTAAAAHSDQIAVALQPGAGAARFLACLFRGADNTRVSPYWLRERLRRAGLRSISPVVDVTNYVMLELGQPMHAYDLMRLRGGFSARRARAGEPVRLLDGRELTLDDDVLVIADDESAVGLAGVMGGERTAISAGSSEFALEVAWFKPDAIAGRARRFGLQTDASQRFERGVDWRGQERALALATRLIRRITGAAAGPTTTAELPHELPQASTVPLRAARLQRLVGVAIAPAAIEQRLRALGMQVQQHGADFRVQPPSWRFDVGIEADLIEEVVRIGGLDVIQERNAAMMIAPRPLPADEVDAGTVMLTLAARGYQEVVTFGFVDPALQRQLFGEQPLIELVNPIAADLSVMRSSLWPGLIAVARENVRRQQSRVRVFEVANRFLVGTDGQYREQKMLAALALGTRLPEQWGSAATPVDFYDLKGDVEALLALGGEAGQFSFEPGALPCLHPGRSARIVRAGVAVGVVGEMHPGLVRELALPEAPILLEVDYIGAFRAKLLQFREVSRYPRIRRDISFTVPEAVSFATLRERVTVAAGRLLQQLSAFDVYQGDEVEVGRKSVALGLILQDLSRTLTDIDADRVVEAVRDDLRAHLDARIRE